MRVWWKTKKCKDIKEVPTSKQIPRIGGGSVRNYMGTGLDSSYLSISVVFSFVLWDQKRRPSNRP